MEEVKTVTYKKFVIFKIDSEEYGIETLKIRHIEEIMPITRVPGTPDFIKGVINLRGEIIPVIDLRKRFNMDEREADENTRIIILSVDEIVAGVIVDEVTETLQISEDDIENAGGLSLDAMMEYVTGIGKVGNRVITIVNFEKLIKI